MEDVTFWTDFEHEITSPHMYCFYAPSWHHARSAFGPAKHLWSIGFCLLPVHRQDYIILEIQSNFQRYFTLLLK